MKEEALLHLAKAVERLERATSLLAKGYVPDAADARKELTATNAHLTQMREIMEKED